MKQIHTWLQCLLNYLGNQVPCRKGAKGIDDLDLLGDYHDALVRGGPDCEEVLAIRSAHKDDPFILEHADTFDSMNRFFHARYRRLIPLPEGEYSAGLVALITGPPGSGKGTQAARIAREFGFLHLSVGDLLRAERKADTELGREAAAFMDAGELVPDSIISATVLARLPEHPLTDNEAKLCKALHAKDHEHELLRSILPGVLLDGFPRTVEQAHLLKSGLQARGNCEEIQEVGLVIHLKVPDHIVTGRLLDRGRSDDTEETVKRRLEVYYEQTAPVLSMFHYALVEIDGSKGVDEVLEVVRRAVADRL